MRPVGKVDDYGRTAGMETLLSDKSIAGPNRENNLGELQVLIHVQLLDGRLEKLPLLVV